MPTLSIGNDINYFYEDSGAPSREKYTTFVFVHGMGFNGGVYKKLFPLAERDGFRVVAMYRRDYAPSSPFTEAELKVLGEGPEGLAKFWREIGVDFALFLAKFIEISGVPEPVSGDQLSEGVVPVGWSLGTSTVHAMLSVLDEVPENTLQVLNRHIKTIIVHDPATSSIGAAVPKQIDMAPWFDPDVSSRFQFFKGWATAYFKHDDILYTTGNADTVNYSNYADGPHTFSECTAEEVEKLTCMSAFGGSDTLSNVLTDPAFFRQMTRKAVFNKALAAKLPARVRYYYGGETPGLLVAAIWELEKGAEDPSFFEGEHARDLKILHTKTGNHFIFWDEPEKAWEAFKNCIA